MVIISCNNSKIYFRYVEKAKSKQMFFPSSRLASNGPVILEREPEGGDWREYKMGQ